MNRFISFGVSDEEKHEIEVYCQAKRRWKAPGDLARDAVYQMMARNPIYKKNGKDGSKNGDLPLDTTYPGIPVRSTA